MPKATAITGPKFKAWDPDTGLPLAGGKVYTYEAGGTVTNKATYADENQAAENTNPVILNDYGEADIYLAGSYSIEVKKPDGTLVWSKDPVSDASQLGLEWINEKTATQVSANQFSVVGDFTSLYVAGLRVRLYDAGYLYATVISTSYVAGNTIITVRVNDSTAITAGLATAWNSIVGPESIGDWASRRVYVNDYGSDATGVTSSVTAFQAAIDATPNSGVQHVYVPAGTYAGDMTTLSWGLRSHVIFVEDDGTVTYPDGAPLSRIYGSSSGLLSLFYNDTDSYVPYGIRSELTLTKPNVAGLAWSALFTVNVNATTGSNENSAIVARAINNGTSDDNMRAIDAVARDTTSGSIEYGATYPITPIAHNGACIAYEGNTFRTNVWDDSGKRGAGVQLTAGGGTECANGIEISATQNTTARTHDGVAQAGGASTITLAATAKGTDSWYNDRLVTIISGTGAGQVRLATGYVGATKVLTVDAAWTTVPDPTSTYLVYDRYWTGVWRRGIKIWDGALNPDVGVGLYVQSNCGYGSLVEGITQIADYAVVRTDTNTAKTLYSVGSSSGAVFEETVRGGDSAGPSSAVQYAKMQVVISDATAGAHSGYIRFYPAVSGTAEPAGYAVKIGAGVVIGDASTLTEQGISTVNINGGYYHTNNKVVGPRKAGWTAATGTATRTGFDTTTVTTAVLAEHVKALIDDLHSTAGHGLIGA